MNAKRQLQGKDQEVHNLQQQVKSQRQWVRTNKRRPVKHKDRKHKGYVHIRPITSLTTVIKETKITS